MEVTQVRSKARSQKSCIWAGSPGMPALRIAPCWKSAGLEKGNFLETSLKTPGLMERPYIGAPVDSSQLTASIN